MCVARPELFTSKRFLLEEMFQNLPIFLVSENRSLSSFYFDLCKLGSISLGNFFKHKTFIPEECIKCWSICSYFEFYSYTYSMIKYSRLGSTMCCPWHSRDKKTKKVQFFSRCFALFANSLNG